MSEQGIRENKGGRQSQISKKEKNNNPCSRIQKQPDSSTKSYTVLIYFVV